MKNIVIIYHGDCHDGFSAAWAAWKKFGNSAEYIEGAREKPPSVTGKIMYILDFSYSEKTMRRLIKNNKNVTIIDHHITAKRAARLTKDYAFDVNRSGAVLAWQYFHSNKSIPILLRYVEDEDLRLYRLQNNHEIMQYVELFDFTFANWNKLASELENPQKRKKIVKIGTYLVTYKNRVVSRIVKHAYQVLFEGRKALAVGVSMSRQFAPDIARELLAKKFPIVILWSETKGVRSVSLFSHGRIDVEKIARKYGGGGHKFRAAFRMNAVEPTPWKLVPVDT